MTHQDLTFSREVGRVTVVDIGEQATRPKLLCEPATGPSQLFRHRAFQGNQHEPSRHAITQLGHQQLLRGVCGPGQQRRQIRGHRHTGYHHNAADQ